MAAELALGLAIALLLIAAGLLIAALLWARRSQRRLVFLQTELQRALVDGRAMAERIAALEAIRDVQQTAEHVLETGGSVVREVHKGIANIPFDILEAIPATRGASRVVRGVHDSITDGVYGALSGLNKAVGRELRKGIKLDEAAGKASTTSEIDLGKLPPK